MKQISRADFVALRSANLAAGRVLASIATARGSVQKISAFIKSKAFVHHTSEVGKLCIFRGFCGSGDAKIASSAHKRLCACDGCWAHRVRRRRWRCRVDTSPTRDNIAGTQSSSDAQSSSDTHTLTGAHTRALADTRARADTATDTDTGTDTYTHSSPAAAD